MKGVRTYNHLIGNTRNLQYPHEKFIELYNQGLNDSEISKVLNCNRQTITLKRNKFKLPPNFVYKSEIQTDKLKELHSEGLNDSEIAKHFNIGARWVGEKRKNIGLASNYDRVTNRSEQELSFEEEQILIGTVLGDSSLKKACVNGGTRCSFCHGIKQKEYALWKANKLKRFLLAQPHEADRFHKVSKKTYRNITVSLKTDTILNKYLELFYDKKIKVVKQELLNLIEPLALSVWFMDDGYKGTHGGYYIATNCFSEDEVNLIINHFKNKWNLNCSIHKNIKNKRVLYIKKESAEIFKNLIESHIHETLKYKLHEKENK